MMAPRFWADARPGWIARALGPLGAVYGEATARRMARPGVRASAPVVCVGNFTVGGAGKTPTAIAIAKLLRSLGERPAFLSRGHGGAPRTAPLRVDSNRHRARVIGDEPLLLARVAPCWVGVDRVASARAAIAAGASVLVMDDGLQNPALVKDLAFAVVDVDARFGNGLCLPAGPLRAPVAAQMPFVHALVAIGEGGSLESIAGDKPILRARLQPDAVAASRLIGRSVLAFAGIARPAKFFATLEGIGARLAATRVFPDHHRFTSREIEALLARATANAWLPVTTEKDHARIPPDLARAVAVLPVTLRFDAPEEATRLLAEAVG
jgi:tetraacyldisaccharide 4'-kinase